MQLSPPSRVVLHGRLRKKFGPEFNISVPTPGHAIYALMTIKPGFREEISKGQYRVVRGPVKTGLHLDDRLIGIQLAGNVLHIIPAAKGRGRSGGGIAKIIIGVVLVVLAVFTYGGSLAAGSSYVGALGASTGIGSVAAVGLLGAALIFSGIGSLLTQTPKPVNPRQSFMLSGPINTNAQGGPVPLAYGLKVRIGSVVVSSGYEAIAITNFYSISTTSGASFLEGLKFGPSGVEGAATGSVTSVAVSQPGIGYTHATATFAPTLNGTAAAATCVIRDGGVEEVNVTSGGTGYGASPQVIISGDGTGAIAIATVTETYGVITVGS